jgi:phage terminase small subunit
VTSTASASRQRDARKALTPRQNAFVQEYASTLNATQAALNAGYALGTAHTVGRDLLQHPGIYARLARKARARYDHLDLEAAQTLERWRRLAGGTLAVCYDAVTGNPKRVSELTAEEAYTLEAVETDADGRIIKAKLAGKVDALKFLSKHQELAADAPPLPAQPSTVINNTEVYLGSLSTDDLRVIERVLVQQQQVSGVVADSPSSQVTITPLIRPSGEK